MNNNLKFGAFAMAALALTACSSEELIDNNVANNAREISFSVASELTTRGQQSYCNSNLPGDFTVLAKYYANNGIYFDKQTATKNGAAWTLGKTTYWPEEALDFVAWKNANDNYDYNSGRPKFTGFAPAANAGDQLDFIYAVTPNKTSGQVKLNFRHALSQVVFRADNASDLKIEIKGVKVGKIHSEGDFTLPALSTEKNYENHTNIANGSEANVENQGTWDNVAASALKDYTVTLDNSKTIGTDIVWLTEVNHNEGGDLSMLLLPQEATAWDPTVKSADFNGAYFALDVVMTNADGKVVYDKEACVPVSINWEQGVRYIYTFHFTEGGNGGYTPDPNDPQPVLTNITFDLSTDDFKPADNNDNNMNAGQTTPETPDPTFSGVVNFYNAEGNVIADAAKTFTNVEVANQTVNLPVVTKDNYTFKGWATVQNPSASDVVIEPTETTTTVTLTEAGVTVNYYPYFEENQKYEHKLILISDKSGSYDGHALDSSADDSYVVYEQTTYNETETITLDPAKITYTGEEPQHYFLTWRYINVESDSSLNGEDVEGNNIPVKGTVVVKVIWSLDAEGGAEEIGGSTDF